MSLLHSIDSIFDAFQQSVAVHGDRAFLHAPASATAAYAEGAVTMTTVGYGDIAPQTVVGKVLASIVMILGYGIIAIPTGIFTMEIVQAGLKKQGEPVSTQACPSCSAEGHDADAVHCKYCGAPL